MVLKIGTQSADWLAGGNGNDELWGRGGNDIVVGGVGNDQLYGEQGNDFLDGGAGDDYLDGGEGADSIIGGAGIDTVGFVTSNAGVSVDLNAGTGKGGQAEGDTYSGIENVRGSRYADHINGNGAANLIEGGDGNDYLYGHGGNDRLYGGSGNDLLWGGSGADLLDGGIGTDTASYAWETSRVHVDMVRNVLSGAAAGDRLVSIENLVGTDFDDYLRAGDGTNRLSGGKGNDTLVGGLGADVLDGGAGSDTVNYLTAISGVKVDLYNRQGTGGEAAGDTFISIENVYGSLFNDEIIGDNGDNRIHGDVGDDNIRGGMGNDSLWGGAGNDRINGGGGNDYLDGGAGDDILSDLDGANTFVGGAGQDIVDYSGFTRPNEAVSVNLTTGKGDWSALGDTYHSIEKARGGAGNDHLTGSAGANSLDGGDGNDVLYGLGGADRLYGGAGIDTASYSQSNAGVLVLLKSGKGHEGHAQGDVLIDIENVIGSAFADRLHGDDNANMLQGGAGNDDLRGYGGGDTIVGGLGADYMVGGGSLDVFRFDSLQDSGTTAKTMDRITDFDAYDVLDLSRIDARPDLAGDQAFQLIGTNAFTAMGQIRYYSDSNATYVQVNADADMQSDMTIRLDGMHVLTVADFVL